MYSTYIGWADILYPRAAQKFLHQLYFEINLDLYGHIWGLCDFWLKFILIDL